MRQFLFLRVLLIFLGEMDHRVGETCRYVVEAPVQALQFDEAEKHCHMALNIHREKRRLVSLEEAANKRLMGLIYEREEIMKQLLSIMF